MCFISGFYAINKNNNGITAATKVRIYQIKSIESEYIFKDYAYVKKQGHSVPPAELYRVVFDGQLASDNLEDIYRIFNMEHPDGYKGKLLSVSDIVEFYDDKNSSFFYCNTIGYKKIRFKPVKYQYMLITVNERDIMNIQIFPNIMEARHKMEIELLEKLYGSFDDYDEDDDYGINETSAWSNPGSNWDWTIIELSVDKNLKITTDFISR